jgi:formylglycine-generating enzyme required for sulfatase activity/CRP-like cAMP-binding protein/predicted  nucleic acid-binding Zn-ribbon protein
MGAAKNLIEKKALRNFVPLDALSAVHLEEISRKAVIEEIRSGRYVFKKGDRDYQSVYLIEGKVELIADGREVVGMVDAGSDPARHPLAHKQPRNLSARAVGSVTVARIDSSLLDVLLTWNESSGYDVVEIDAEENEDWMTRMLQSEAFLQLPPSNIHQLLMRLEEVTLSAGDAVVRQGDEGDYFYIVKTGRLAVSRKASPRSKEVLLAELGEGACFGEEALVSDASRNASVTMLTDGTLMRLCKDDFKQLLCAPMVHEVGFTEAQELIAQGARWLDVRLPGEYENQSLEGSINVPLSALRDQSAELDNAVSYVICCDTGRRSAAGAFLLGQRGLTVYTLKNGLMGVPEAVLDSRGAGAGGVGKGQDAEIIPFGADAKGESEASRRDEGARPRSPGVARDVHNESRDFARAALQQQLEYTQKQLEELQIRLQEAEAQRAEEQAISARVIEQIDTLEKDLQRALKERAELEQRLSQYQTDNQSEKVELAQLSARLDREQREHEKQARLLQQELVQIRDDYKQLGQRAGALASERDSVATELEKVRDELVELGEKLVSQQSESSRQTDALRRELDRYSTELESEKDQRRLLEQQLAELADKHQQLEQNLGESSQREQALQVQLQEAEQRSEEAVEAARGDAAGAQDALNQRIAELQSELDSQRAQLQDEQSQREEFEHKLGTAEQALTEAQAREQALQVQLQDAEQGAANYRREVRQAGEHAEDLRRDLEELQRKRTESEQRIAELEQRLAEEAKDHKSEIATVRDALGRAQDERENVKRDQKRLMDSVRKAEHKLERERQDHEAEVHRLRKELKQTAGESNSGLASELEMLQQKLKQSFTDREELELKLGERSAQLEDVQAQMSRVAKQLEQAQDSARQAEQQLVEATQAANEEMTIRLNAEQEIQQALRLDLKQALLERDEHQTQLSLLTQESVALRGALDPAQRLIDELREQLKQVERERNAARDAEQVLRQQADQLRADAEASRGLVTMAPESPDLEALTEQLEQARRNADSAMRERGEAEQQLCELQQEVECLRAELSGLHSDTAAETEAVQIRSLDSEDPDANSILDGDLEQLQAAWKTEPGATVLLDEEYSASVVRAGSDAGEPGTAKALFLAAVVVASLAGGLLWWLERPLASGQEHLPPAVADAEPPGSDMQAGQGTIAAPGESIEAQAPAGGTLDFVKGAPDFSALRSEPNDAPVSQDASEPAPQQLAESDVEASGASGSAAAAEQPVASRQPGLEFRDRLRAGGSGPGMVELYADSFQMGSGSASPNFDERPRRDITVKRFALSKYEVTFEQYDRFAEATGRARPRSAWGARGSHPVTNVSWKDAAAYAEWLTTQTGYRYRLPTEAEWEFAARAGTITRYWWGNKVGTAQANCFDCGTEWAGRETAPVGSFPASPFGLHDLAGNAREWVKDCYAPNYKDAPVDGSAVDVSQCPQRVIRGGSYSSPATKLRVTTRDQGEPDMRLDDLGFRVAREY